MQKKYIFLSIYEKSVRFSFFRFYNFFKNEPKSNFNFKKSNPKPTIAVWFCFFDFSVPVLVVLTRPAIIIQPQWRQAKVVEARYCQLFVLGRGVLAATDCRRYSNLQINCQPLDPSHGQRTTLLPERSTKIAVYIL